MSDSLDDLVAEFRSWLTVERGLAPNSIAAYSRDLARYVAFLRTRGLHDPASVQERDVVAYAADLANATDDDGAPRYAPATIARAIVAVRALHRFALDEDIVDHDPTEELTSNRVPQGIPKALSEADINALLDAVTGDDPRALRDRAVLETLYAGGVRIAELVGLDRADVDLTDGLVRVFGKGRKERVVPIGRVARRGARRVPPPGPARARTPPASPGAAGRRSRVPQRARWAPVSAGVLADRPRRRHPCRSGRRSLAPCAAPLLRHPHARPRRRHPGGAGAARPREPLDHAGVHESVAGAAPTGVRGRPPPRPERPRSPSGGGFGRKRRRIRAVTSRHGRDAAHGAARTAPVGAGPPRRAAALPRGRRRRSQLRRELRRLEPGHRGAR